VEEIIAVPLIPQNISIAGILRNLLLCH